MKHTTLSALCLSLFASFGTQAKEASFVVANESHSFQILLAPGAADSGQTRNELAELHRIELERTPEQVAQAVADDKDESIFIFRAQLGDWFNAQTLPQVAALSARVKNDEGIATEAAKNGFARVRPYNLDHSLHPVCVTKTKNDSYPSGHTTAGYLMALTLIDLIPEQRDAILARANSYAYNRLVCGVHYRSDTEASKLLAYAVHAVMATKPAYQQEMAAARAELRALPAAATLLK